jgi:hypothetical protein
LVVVLAAGSAYTYTAFFQIKSPVTATDVQRTVTSVGGEITVTNGVKHIVPLEKLLSGGPPKDGIPSIDYPKFVSAEEADTFLVGEDLVFGLDFGGAVRAYPALILVWHEIVNDWVKDEPILVTYCPLCYTSVAFERRINGEAVEFGVSGKLYNSDLVMYDRLTDSYWSQVLGKAIVGELAGQELRRIPLDHTTWAVWKRMHPETQVLSRDTGHVRAYGSDPYGGYYTSGQIWFPVENRDDRLHPKELVYGIIVGGEQKAYVKKALDERGVVNDRVGGVDVVVLGVPFGPARAYERRVGDTTLDFVVENGKIFDVQTRSEWTVDGVAISGAHAGTRLTRIVGITSFWFAWVAFYPNTTLYM